MVYPSELQGGFPKGSVQETPTLYRVSTCAGGQRCFKPFYFSISSQNTTKIPEDQIFDNNEDAHKAAKKYMIQENMII